MIKMSSLFSNACLKTWSLLLDDPVDLLIKHLSVFSLHPDTSRGDKRHLHVKKLLFKTDTTFKTFNSLCCINVCKSLRISLKIDKQWFALSFFTTRTPLTQLLMMFQESVFIGTRKINATLGQLTAVAHYGVRWKRETSLSLSKHNWYSRQKIHA